MKSKELAALPGLKIIESVSLGLGLLLPLLLPRAICAIQDTSSVNPTACTSDAPWDISTSFQPGPGSLTEDMHCAMYGVCDAASNRPCVGGGPAPINIDQTGRFCSKILWNKYSNGEYVPSISLCCDADQTKILTRLLYMPESLFGKCPSCFENLMGILCLLTCAPDQSKWLKVTGTGNGPDEAVSAVGMNVTLDYAVRLFESCRDVHLVPTGRPMTDHLCGAGENSSTCTAEKWFQWIGNPVNGLTPFEINFQLVNEPSEFAYNEPTHECGRPPPGYDWDSACQCEDCPLGQVCDGPDPETTPEPDELSSTEWDEPSSADFNRRSSFIVLFVTCMVLNLF